MMHDAESLKREFKRAGNLMHVGALEVTMTDSANNTTSRVTITTQAPTQGGVANNMSALAAQMGSSFAGLGLGPALGLPPSQGRSALPAPANGVVASSMNALTAQGNVANTRSRVAITTQASTQGGVANREDDAQILLAMLMSADPLPIGPGEWQGQSDITGAYETPGLDSDTGLDLGPALGLPPSHSCRALPAVRSSSRW